MDLSKPTKKCPTCGKLITHKSKTGRNWAKYCKKECNPFYGVKRPKHSVFMKKRTSTGKNSSAIKKGQLLNKKVNSDSFKVKAMKTAGWEIKKGLSVKENYSRYNSWKVKQPKTRLKTINSVYAVLDEDLKELFRRSYGFKNIEDLNEKDVPKAFPILWGLRTIHYNRRDSNDYRSYWKRTKMVGMKHNVRGITSVYTRSSYETNMINFLEKNKTKWDYEPFVITSIDKQRHYVPDFWIEYEGLEYIVEVKGQIERTGEEDYVMNKLYAGYLFAKENNMKFILMLEARPKSFNFLKESEIKENFFNDYN